MQIQHLDALCTTTGWHRKHAVRALRQQETVAPGAVAAPRAASSKCLGEDEDWLNEISIELDAACAGCEKQLIRNGDPEHRAMIARGLRENRIPLERAKAEAEDGQIGANEHARHLARGVAALEATMAVHDDASIADGAYVQLDLSAILAKAEAAE